MPGATGAPPRQAAVVCGMEKTVQRPTAAAQGGSGGARGRRPGSQVVPLDEGAIL